MDVLAGLRAVALAVGIGAVGGLVGCASLLGSSESVAPPPLETTDSVTTRTFLEVAAIREDASDWNGALGRIDKALALQPRSRTALLRRAQLVGVAADADGTAPDLEDVRGILAEAQGGDDAELLLAQAWLDTSEGRIDAARAGAQRAADAGSDSARVQWMAARLFARAGDTSESLAAAERAVALDPRMHAAQRERARARLRSGDFENALIDVGTQLRAHPDDLETHQIEGEIYWRLGSFANARDAYESIPASRRNAATLAAIGWLALRDDQRDTARSALEDGIATHPTDARLLDAMLALDQREKRLGESITRLDAAAAARPDDAAVARLRARALAAGSHPDDAAAAFGRALELAPGDAATYDAIAAWLGTSKAEDAEQRLARLGGGVAPMRVAQGSVRLARGDRAGAITALQQAVDADPSLPIARAALARALATAGQQLDRALDLAREARAARPHDADVAWSLGIAYLRRGQAKAAFEVLRDATGAYPVERDGYGEIFLNAAEALEGEGERDMARTAARIALAHAGNQEPSPSWKAPAKALLARLEPAPQRDAGKPVAKSDAPATGGAPAQPGSADAPANVPSAASESKPAAAPVEAIAESAPTPTPPETPKAPAPPKKP